MRRFFEFTERVRGNRGAALSITALSILPNPAKHRHLAA